MIYELKETAKAEPVFAGTEDPMAVPAASTVGGMAVSTVGGMAASTVAPAASMAAIPAVDTTPVAGDPAGGGDSAALRPAMPRHRFGIGDITHRTIVRPTMRRP